MNQALQTIEKPKFLTAERIKLIKSLYCKKASDIELAHFLEVCESRKLDPVLKQIYAVFRFDKKAGRDVMSIQLGIDGFRVIASRTGEYAGSDAAIFDHWDDSGFIPGQAAVTVYRMVKGHRCAFTAEAHWDEYYPGKGNASSFFWDRMPKGQLAKCAESQALRKAFPGDLSGIFEPAEMNQAGFQAVEAETAASKSTAEKLAAFIDRVDEIQIEKRDPKDLVIPNGSLRGTKLSSKSRKEWEQYVREIEGKLANIDFPDGMRESALEVLDVIQQHLSTDV